MQEISLDKLMTYEEYNSLKISMSLYSFDIHKYGKYLYYIGSNHSFNPEDEQYALIERRWNEFSQLAKNERPIVFVESKVWPIESSKLEAIKKHFENGFITYLASQRRTEIYCPEPDPTWERNELLKAFSKDEIQTYYFVRLCWSWNNRIDKPDLYTFMQEKLEEDMHESSWINYDFSYKAMIGMYEKVLKHKFDLDDQEFFASIIAPTQSFEVTNKVAKVASRNRDEHIISQILKHWQEGYSIFIVFGLTHAIMQERAIISNLN